MTVKPNTLQAIKEGFLKEYAREIRPNTQKKYCDLDEEGYVKDIDGVLQPRKYDVVQFENIIRPGIAAMHIETASVADGFRMQGEISAADERTSLDLPVRSEGPATFTKRIRGQLAIFQNRVEPAERTSATRFG